MANLLNGITGIINAANQGTAALNNQVPLTQSQAAQFQINGIPPGFQSDNNGLPYTRVANFRQGVFRRNIITWYVPQFGTVRMYVNPTNISYAHKKLITPDRTKGGYTLQYWGEELTTINITGTTGSSGIEGINALYEVYRAEQYAFDPVALTLAQNNASNNVTNNIIGGAGAALGNQISQLVGGSPNSPSAGAGAGIIGGILGLASPNNNLSVQNLPSLAQLAFTLEMYYAGWVFRGYMSSMTINEHETHLIDYVIVFMVTQKRGQRVNMFPWERSAKDGPSRSDTPHSWSGNVQPDQ